MTGSCRYIFLSVVFTTLVPVVALSATTYEELKTESMAAYQKQVQPLLETYCSGCHGAEKSKADLRFDQLDPDMADGKDGETWHDVLTTLNLGEMPPEDEENQPTAGEREVLIQWLTSELKRATDVRRSTGGRIVVRRLTNDQYENTLQDLLGLDLAFAEDLPADPRSPDGFQNNGSSLQITHMQLSQYLAIARDAVEKAIVTGEQPELVSYSFTPPKEEAVKEGEKKKIKPDSDPNHGGVLAIPEYARGGPFRLVIEASVPQGSALMQVSLGQRFSKDKGLKVNLLGEARVTESRRQYEFVGRMENFPTRGEEHTGRFAGLMVVFENLTSSRAKMGEGGILIHSVSYEAPIYESWPPPSHRNILFSDPLSERDERAYIEKVLERFITRAFRRPAQIEEVQRALEVYDEHRKNLPSLELAMRETLPELLISPKFLYLAEPSLSEERVPLTGHELASRLSYFLWGTMPDDELFDLAGSGKIMDPDVRRELVRSMIDDERSWGFVESFVDQWLDLSSVHRVAINPEFYPKFDSRLKDDMRLETLHFFDEILQQDLSALTLLDADFTMINEPLAEHYGLNKPEGLDFVKVSLNDDHARRRGGILGHASTLLGNSSGDDSHPILRAVWIRDRLLGAPPASPPPDVPELETNNPKHRELTLRQRLELHREKESCNSCHKNLDPWGIPLENFDAVGKWRTEIRKSGNRKMPVDAVSVLPGGQKLDGIEGLRAHLTGKERDRFVRAFVSRLFAYSLGRSVEITDHADIESLIDVFRESDYNIKSLIVAITDLDTFNTK